MENKNNPTQQKPLYKVLNQQRTQGEWKLPEQEKELNSYSLITDGMSIATVYAIDIPDEEGLANAQYTALSVNNLHHLAEALEILTKEINLGKLNIKKDFSLINAHANALKALHRIS